MSNEAKDLHVSIENADDQVLKEFAEFLEALDSDEVSEPLLKRLGTRGTYCVRCQSGHQEEFKSCGMAGAMIRAATICGGPFSLHKGSC